MPELKGKPIGLVGSGPFTAQAALYAAALDGDFDWLVTEGGFVSFRSFVDRPVSLRASYQLATSFDAAWDVIDQEIPAALYVFGVLERLDLPDLYGMRASRPVLLVAPIDGERQALSEADTIKLLRVGRFRWPKLPQVVTGKEAERRLRDFIQQ